MAAGNSKNTSSDPQISVSALYTDLVDEVLAKVDHGPTGQVVGFLASLNDDTDLTIKLNYHTWKVHSNLLVTNSPFFQVICNGEWKESKERVVELHDDDPWIFARLLQFVYCNDYEGNCIGTRSPDVKHHLTIKKLVQTGHADPMFANKSFFQEKRNQLGMHFEVYELADKYGCNDLQNLARKNIARDVGEQEIVNFRAMIRWKSLDEWRDLAAKDDTIKQIFARKFATNYMQFKIMAKNEGRLRQVKEGERKITPLNEWLRWLEEDSSFGIMVIDVLTGTL